MIQYILITIILTFSCTHQNQKKYKNRWEIPDEEENIIYKKIENLYPEVFEAFYSYKLPVYKVEIKPESLKFDCILRNDSPYYWCGFEAELKNPSPKYPSLINASFMSSRNKEFTDKYGAFIEKVKNQKEKLYLLTTATIDGLSKIDGREIFLFPFFSMYNQKSCINWYNYLEDCPKTAEKIIIN